MIVRTLNSISKYVQKSYSSHTQNLQFSEQFLMFSDLSFAPQLFTKIARANFLHSAAATASDGFSAGVLGTGVMVPSVSVSFDFVALL
jgi:hypothetical protein